jgi:hypothetical protein
MKAILVSLAVVVAGCNSGTWVDGTWLVGCDMQKKTAEAKGAEAENGKKAMEMEAHAICRKAGKAFTGDLRCENNVGQVKCK